MNGPSDAQADDNDHFEALYRGSYKAIFGYVLRRTGGDAESVADLVAEVFVVALRKQSAIPPPPEDRLWLYGIARRVVLDHQQRRRRWRRLQSRLQEQAAFSQVDPGEPPRQRVQAAIARLNPADREVLQLVAWDGLSHTEAAQVLGCTANAVALRLHKARSRLRRILSPPAGPARPSTFTESQFVVDSSRSQS
jgi:RNA polymerase sigma-70 factor (ECF subfamily)